MARDIMSEFSDFSLFPELLDDDGAPAVVASLPAEDAPILGVGETSPHGSGDDRSWRAAGDGDAATLGLTAPGPVELATTPSTAVVATVAPVSGPASWLVEPEVSVSSEVTINPIHGCGCPMCSDDRSDRPDGGSPSSEGPPGAPGPAGSLQTLANYLRDGFWNDFSGSDSRWFNMTSSGTGANSGTLYYNVTGWTRNLATVYGNEADSNGISAARADMARAAFAFYEAVLGIDFVETTSTADSVDFFFKDSAAGAYEAESLHSGTGGAMNFAVINVAASWSGGSSNIGGAAGYTFQTFLHEIGHALGLGHQGNYNASAGTPTYANSAVWANDGWQQTMMSYWDQAENTESSTDSYGHLVSAMAVDWIALNDLYASQGYGTSNAFTGNTIWGVGTNITAATSAAFNGLAVFAATNAFTIVDGGGIDTIDFSNYSANQLIDLTPSSASGTHATLSNVGGLTGNMSLAVGTIIENATSGSGNDTLHGNGVANVLISNDGNDLVFGYGANDAIYGGGGADTLDGGDNNDTISDGTGADSASGGDGNDLLLVGDIIFIGDSFDGGAGTDTLSYESYNWGTPGSPVVFDFWTGLASFNGFNETFTGIEVFRGSNGDETIISRGSGLSAFGLGGNDSLVSAIGVELMDGGSGIDTIDHRAWDGDYVFDMDTGATNFTSESYTAFEVVFMGDGNDSVTGVNVQSDTIYGGLGNDTIVSGVLTVGDVAYGGGGNDSLVSGLGNESMYGEAGIDTIDQRAYDGNYIFNMTTGLTNFAGELHTGFEVAFMGDGNDSVTGVDLQSDTVYGGLGDDTIVSGIVTVRDVAYGGGGNDSLVSGLGVESMDGGSGIDTIDHRAFDGDYVFDMGTGATNFTFESHTAFEVVFMGDGDDSVTGTTGSDTIHGGLGSDSLRGAAGNDSLGGGDGADTLNGLAGNDTMAGGAGADVYVVDSATDIVSEQANGGIDVVRSFVTRTLGLNQENLTLVGTDSINGAGNADNNVLIGNAAVNTLNGLAGNDTMAGGLGNDVYVVDSTADIVSEQANGGIDLVKSSVTRTLGVNQENLTLLGADSINATGNADNNVLIGNTAANILNGAAGNDTIAGGAGNDTYVVDAAGDIVSEQANGGIDLVKSFLTRTLGLNQENLTLMGADAINGAGNAGNNVIVGNAAANALNGNGGNDTINGAGGNDTVGGGAGAGQDRLFGGIGSDRFDFNDVVETAVGATRDVIQDFEAGAAATFVDRIDLSGIDANALLANNQAFSFIGGAAFTAGVAAQVRAVQLAGGQTVIQGNTDGDVAAEFEILIANSINLSNLGQNDFLL